MVVKYRESRNEFLAQIPEELQDCEALSPRQRQVVSFIAEGYTIKEIANKLGISYSATVNYFSDACQRLHCTRYQVVHKAHLIGVV